jgi:lipid A disaccharide synthetase
MNYKAVIQVNIEELIGDRPVSEQISNAMQGYNVTRAEFEALKKEVAKLAELLGDSPVSEQINKALQDWR